MIVESDLGEWEPIRLIPRIVKEKPKVAFVFGDVDNNAIFMESV